MNKRILKKTSINTRLGAMTAIADDNYLYLLAFSDRFDGERHTERFKNFSIISGSTMILKNIEAELSRYFSEKNFIFKTPVKLMGTVFQNSVWRALQKISSGDTCSYAAIAQSIQKPTAYRAVANANAANPLAIIVPCHRVINATGEQGGYAGGVERKKWLLDYEKK